MERVVIWRGWWSPYWDGGRVVWGGAMQVERVVWGGDMQSIVLQVERAVVSQLADAFEQGSLCVGNQVCLVVETAGTEGAATLKLKISPDTVTDNYSNPIGEEVANFGSF